ncbi:mucin-associated surface protein (MASP), putative, partial [Trypanosoma cruzi marinkellei]
MAMMMTGRVLLVCALCVLWCGVGCGGVCEEAPADFLSGGSGGLGREGVDSQHSARPEAPGAHTPGPKTTLPEVQEKVLSSPPEATVSGTEDAAEEQKAKKKSDVEFVAKQTEVDGTGQEIKKPENTLISVMDSQSHEKEGLQPPLLDGTHESETVTPSEDGLQVNKDKQNLSSPLQLPLPNSSTDGNPPSTSAAGLGEEKSN